MRTEITMHGEKYSFYTKRPFKPAPGRLADTKLVGRSEPGDEPWTTELALRRYPRIVAHMMSESLGYFTVRSAATALADALNGRENWCEYIYSCYRRNPVEMVRQAIARRHHHTGYMAWYDDRALPQVASEIEGLGEPGRLAGWF